MTRSRLALPRTTPGRFFRGALLAAAAFVPREVPAQALPGKGGQEPAQTLTFDVASVRPSRSDDASSNVPLGPGDVFTPAGGIFTARNITLLTFVDFAYKVTDFQQEALENSAPAWVSKDRFTIEARTENSSVTKDQLRLMMRSLLAERFHLAVHYETRQVRVFVLLPAKPGTLGSRLRSHPAKSTCGNARSAGSAQTEQPVQPTPGSFPAVCGGILGLTASAQDRYSFGASGVPMGLIASALSSWGSLGRPVLDRTGLSGTFDFVLEYTPDPRPAYATTDSGGPGFQEALKQQLGLKLDAQRGPVEFLVLDHIEHSTEN